VLGGDRSVDHLRRLAPDEIGMLRASWLRESRDEIDVKQPFSSEAFFTWTKSASWKARSKHARDAAVEHFGLLGDVLVGGLLALIVSVFSFATIESSPWRSRKPRR